LVLGRRRGDTPARHGTPSDLLVVGLGNPGREFAGTRHNMGADAVELLASRAGQALKRSKDAPAQVAEIHLGTHRVALAVPTTYMNESGRAVAPLCRRYGIEDPSRLVVIHDELDLPPGRIRVKVGGGLAGNNGLRSIRDHLHTTDFVRIRIGIGKPPGGSDRGADHVLSRPSRRDSELMAVCVEEAADAITVILDDGIDAAMGRFNAAR
jgi:PTH1 family peptidyl-tRNA hydrolase